MSSYVVWMDNETPVRVGNATSPEDAMAQAQAAVDSIVPGRRATKAKAIPNHTCWDPVKCAGRNSCPKEKACNE
jgi:hypothetical protein